MPDRRLCQTTRQDQLVSGSPLFPSSIAGKTESEIIESCGLLRINGKWVDPDSERAMYEAVHGHSNANSPLCPGMKSSSGPYILSKSEQSLVYAQYMEDQDDNEGDPRAFRISPNSFAIWAEGAMKIQQPPHVVMKQPVSTI